MLWDTAGQEEFDAITKAYYRGAQACVLAFSTTDRDSFEAAHSWKMKVLADLVTTGYQVRNRWEGSKTRAKFRKPVTASRPYPCTLPRFPGRL